MSWNAGYTYVDGIVYDAANLNAYWRDNLRYLHGTGVSTTARDLPVVTPGVYSTGDELSIYRAYSATPTIYRFLAERMDAPTTIATGAKLRVVLMVRAGVDGWEERLGEFLVERTGSGSGKISFFPYVGNTQAFGVPAFAIDSSGRLLINQASGSYTVDVDGTVSAQNYRVGGSTIGQWTLVGRKMTFTGSAEVSGQLVALTTTKAPFDVQSTTKVTNLNAAKMRGYDWPGALEAATSAPVTVYEDADPVNLLSLSVTRVGWYACVAEATMPVTSAGNLPTLQLFGPGAYARGDAGMSASSNVAGDIVSVKVVYSAYVGTAPSTLAPQVKLSGQAVGSVSGSMTALWTAPGTLIYPVGIAATQAFGSPTLTVT